jgi:hypothetical protein
MFTETVESPGNLSTGAASEAHALILLRRASSRGYAIEPTREGGAIVRYRKRHLGHPEPVVHTITLAPHVPAGDLVDGDVFTLRAIDDAKVARFTDSDRYALPVIAAGTYEVPPAQTESLQGRHLLAVDDDRNVRLTLSARLGLLAHAHERLATADRLAAWCACGLALSGRDADQIDAILRSHLAAVSAEFLDSLPAAFAAAVTAG